MKALILATALLGTCLSANAFADVVKLACTATTGATVELSIDYTKRTINGHQDGETNSAPIHFPDGSPVMAVDSYSVEISDIEIKYGDTQAVQTKQYKSVNKIIVSRINGGYQGDLTVYSAGAGSAGVKTIVHGRCDPLRQAF